MRIDLQIPAHLCQQVAADFFLPILEGRVFSAEVQGAVGGPVSCAASASEFAARTGTLNANILGHICPRVSLKWQASKP